MTAIYQYVEAVKNFSSQYGSELSYSYVARNLTGLPLDFAHIIQPNREFDSSWTYTLKNYGHWRKEQEHFTPSFSPLNSPSSDFVDVSFKTAVLPSYVKVYQAFSGGCVVRVWGSLEGIGWILLWSAEPENTKPVDLFTEVKINLVESTHYVNFIRMEMDPSLQEYFPSFAAVSMLGWTRREEDSKIVLDVQTPKELFTLYRGGEFDSMIFEGLMYITSKKFKIYETNCTIDNISIKDLFQSSIPVDCGDNGGYFRLLPEELIILILRKVDLRTLCRLSRSCKLMYKYVCDPILYRYLNLKTCWQLVNDCTLTWLKTRCVGMKGLDMTRCGNYGAVTTECFVDFIAACGASLQTLVLDNCDFVMDEALQTICSICGSLKVLSLSGSKIYNESQFAWIGHLPSLVYLDLSRCAVRNSELRLILSETANLTNLKLVDCTLLHEMDEVIAMLSNYNQKLECLEIWKTKGLTIKGVRLLGDLKHLQVADLGWAFSGFLTDALRGFLTSCTQLRVLSLTAWRNITDHDVMSIAKLGHNLEQIDLLGNRNITYDAVKYLLFSCQRLELLDISYCDQMRRYHVEEWRGIFPRVVIKHYQNMRQLG